MILEWGFDRLAGLVVRHGSCGMTHMHLGRMSQQALNDQIRGVEETNAIVVATDKRNIRDVCLPTVGHLEGTICIPILVVGLSTVHGSHDA